MLLETLSGNHHGGKHLGAKKTFSHISLEK